MDYSQSSERKKLSQSVQKFGRFLSGMVMPNIGAFIAWGIITALFIPTGWLPNEKFSSLVGPMITYLLPLLIGYTGGKMVYGVRGGVLGAIATMGVIVGTGIPMFIGGMIMGPIAGYAIKKFDELVDGKIPTGFEMLVNNFSAGIIGMILTLLAYIGIGPAVETISTTLGNGVEAFVNAGLLPLASLFIEPAKILFLNNAINHGVLSPLGIEQATEAGKSIFFLLETNPGPGLGILLAYWVFSKGMIKQSAPSAIITHFLGGIHEIYFPYILMQPSLLLAVIAGGGSGVLTFTVLGAGLVASPSPGSIFALAAMAPKGELLKVLAGVLVATVVSFLVASVLIRKRDIGEDELIEAKNKSKHMKVTQHVQATIDKLPSNLGSVASIKKIVVACDAGMGSSAMGASKLKAALAEKNIVVQVVNTSLESIPSDADLIITHEKLTQRAQGYNSTGQHLSISDFIMTPLYDILVEKFVQDKAQSIDTKVESNQRESVTLKKENIKIGLPTTTKENAIRMAGKILVDGGYVEESYIDAMVQRDQELSTYIGNGTAIPHGVSEAKKLIKYTGISILQFPEGVDFDGNLVYLVVGIAGVGNEHLMILANLAEIVEDEEKVKLLSETTDIDYVLRQFVN